MSVNAVFSFLHSNHHHRPPTPPPQLPTSTMAKISATAVAERTTSGLVEELLSERWPQEAAGPDFERALGQLEFLLVRGILFRAGRRD